MQELKRVARYALTSDYEFSPVEYGKTHKGTLCYYCASCGRSWKRAGVCKVCGEEAWAPRLSQPTDEIKDGWLIT